MNEEEYKQGLKNIKTIFTLACVLLFCMGLAMGYFGAKQSCVNEAWEEAICEDGYKVECIEIDSINNDSIFLDDEYLGSIT